jgi:tetratricopeptide (TPR) repeat protein
MENLGLTGTDNYAIVLVNVAGAYRLVGRFDDALDAYSKAEEIFLKNNTADYYTLSSLYNNTGLVYQDKGELAKAAEFYNKGLEVTKKGTDNDAEVATGLANLAALYCASGDYANADKTIAESLEIFEKLDDGLNAHYAGALNTKAILSFRNGQLEESVKCFEMAIEKTKLIFGENGDYITACRNCAHVLEKLGDNEKAAKYNQLAQSAANK